MKKEKEVVKKKSRYIVGAMERNYIRWYLIRESMFNVSDVTINCISLYCDRVLAPLEGCLYEYVASYCDPQRRSNGISLSLHVIKM